jgi:hypothetical protein
MRKIKSLYLTLSYWIAEYRQLPAHPYSPFYAAWEVCRREQTLVRQYQAKVARELGLQSKGRGWAVPPRGVAGSTKTL